MPHLRVEDVKYTQRCINEDYCDDMTTCPCCDACYEAEFDGLTKEECLKMIDNTPVFSDAQARMMAMCKWAVENSNIVQRGVSRNEID